MIIWEVSKTDLEYALGIVLNVPAKSGMTSSEYIRISECDEGAVLTLASDLIAQSTVAYRFPFSKAIYLDRRLFEPFVSAGKELKGDVYTMSMKKKGILTVKHGSRVAIFSVYKKVSGYPNLPEYAKGAEKMRIYESWSKIMQCAAACATDDPVTPQFNCVYVVPDGDRNLMMYATNTTVVFVGKGTTKKVPSSPIAFPLMLTSALIGNDMEYVSWDDRSATISSERGDLWQPVKSAARKKFPKKELDILVSKLQQNKPVLSLSAEAVGTAADRIAGYLTAVSREDLVLRIKANKYDDRAKLVSGTGDTVFTEHITLLKPAKETVELHWPLDEVLPALEFSKTQGKAEIYTMGEISMYSTEDIKLVIAKRSK